MSETIVLSKSKDRTRVEGSTPQNLYGCGLGDGSVDGAGDAEGPDEERASGATVGSGLGSGDAEGPDEGRGSGVGLGVDVPSVPLVPSSTVTVGPVSTVAVSTTGGAGGAAVVNICTIISDDDTAIPICTALSPPGAVVTEPPDPT